MNSPQEDSSSENFIGLGSAAAEWVRARARQLSLLAGRPVGNVTPVDFEQAKREFRDTRDPWGLATPESWTPPPIDPGDSFAN